MDDQRGWETAGRLALTLHLADAAEGFISEGSKLGDHEMLRGYGYAMTGCPCGVGVTVEEVPLGRFKVAQIAT